MTAGATTYASGAQYASHGAVKGLTLGNGVVDTTNWNMARLQPASIALGSAWSESLYYCAGHALNCASNNGNVMEQDFTAQGTSYVQTYGYLRHAGPRDGKFAGDQQRTYAFTGYAYNRAGSLKQVTYPSGRVVATSGFDALGRPGSVSAGSTSYASNAQYASHGAVKSLTLGQRSGGDDELEHARL